MNNLPEYPPGRGLLAGKTVLVTAAAGTGIGFATAKRCVEEGARVAITDIHARRLAESAAELGAHAGLQGLFLYSRADTIYGGSNQIQRNVIGERALGLPKEPA